MMNEGANTMTLAELTFLILGLNHLVDSGLHTRVTLADAKEHIRCGDVVPWLRQEFGDEIDLSLYEYHSATRDEISKGWQDLLTAYDGSERRKWGVANNGICLLIAWTNELIQQRKWRD
jgi:hypothetical protein